MLRRRRLRAVRILSGLLAALVATVVAIEAMPASAVVGGQVATTTAPGVVRLHFFSTVVCTGTLWKPNIVITAGHCIVNAQNGTPAGPYDLQIWPPGVDWTTTQPIYPGPYQVQWNSAFVKQAIGEPLAAQAIDHAFLIFDQPIGTPYVDRLATPAEAQALSVTQTPMTITGYGDTTQHSVNNLASMPMTVTLAPMQPYYDGSGPGVVTIATNGISGSCSGDSGGPWTAAVLGEVLLVGTDVAGSGPPCNPDGQPTGQETLSVTSGDAGLVQGALSAAGQPAEVVPTTCIAYADGDGDTCEPGTAWNYTGCWSSTTNAVVQQQQADGGWLTIAPMQVQQPGACGGRTPFMLVASGFIGSGSATFRVVQGSQPPDVFVVTVQ